MARTVQTYSNHRRVLPLYHFFAVPILAANVIVTSVHLARNPGWGTAWTVIVALALFVGIVLARTMPLRAQDRVIRLEERNRLREILPPNLKSRVDELSTSQLISLRFAPDEEVPELTQRIVSGELKTAADIKRAVRNWRPDHLRM